MSDTSRGGVNGVNDSEQKHSKYSWRSSRLTNAQEGRRVAVAPLFTYCEQRNIQINRVLRTAAVKAGVPMLTRQELHRIRYGYSRTPEWLIPGACEELGRPITVVMGREWAQQHLPQPANKAS